MAKVSFKKGLLANLPVAISEGTFYITTDERAMYLDVDSTTRVRIGDFQEFATLTALQANTNPSTTALYYVTELNCLAKWDGNKYVQINLDTGATSVEATGTGNALDGVTYDPATRKLTFTKTKTFTTADDVDNQIAAKVGELKIGDETFATVKAYVDKKTDGIATDAALETLTNRVTTAEGKLDKLNGDKTTEGSVAKAVADLQGDTESTVADVDARVCTIEDNYVDNYDVSTAISKAIGTNPDNKTVVELISDAKTAATYDDTEVKAGIAANTAAISTLNGTGEGSVSKAVADGIASIIADAPESLDTLKEISDWISGHESDAASMNSSISSNTAAITALQNLVGTLPDTATSTNIVAYIDEVIDALSIGDYAKAADLTAAVARIAALETNSHTHANKAELDKIAAGDKDKWDAASNKAHEHANKAVLDGIDTTKVANWDAAEQNAKDYTDTALTWGSF